MKAKQHKTKNFKELKGEIKKEIEKMEREYGKPPLNVGLERYNELKAKLQEITGYEQMVKDAIDEWCKTFKSGGELCKRELYERLFGDVK